MYNIIINTFIFYIQVNLNYIPTSKCIYHWFVINSCIKYFKIAFSLFFFFYVFIITFMNELGFSQFLWYLIFISFL